MPPWGGTDALLSTNPLAWAVPAAEEFPIVLDMACSAVARGKIRLAAQKRESIPLGWALGPDGQPTSDARQAMEGTVLPVGGHKGYGLAVINEVLAGALPGARFSFDVVTSYIGATHTSLDAWAIGHLAVAIAVDAFDDVGDVMRRVDRLIRRLRTSRPLDGGEPVRVPGEAGWRERERRLQRGIPLSEPVRRELDQLASELQLSRLKIISSET